MSASATQGGHNKHTLKEFIRTIELDVNLHVLVYFVCWLCEVC